MRIKFDQNMDPRGAAILKQAGHEVLTVKEQNLTGAEDDVIAAAGAGVTHVEHEFLRTQA